MFLFYYRDIIYIYSLLYFVKMGRRKNDSLLNFDRYHHTPDMKSIMVTHFGMNHGWITDVSLVVIIPGFHFK